jgi:hypothetical protein
MRPGSPSVTSTTTVFSPGLAVAVFCANESAPCSAGSVGVPPVGDAASSAARSGWLLASGVSGTSGFSYAAPHAAARSPGAGKNWSEAL